MLQGLGLNPQSLASKVNNVPHEPLCYLFLLFAYLCDAKLCRNARWRIFRLIHGLHLLAMRTLFKNIFAYLSLALYNFISLKLLFGNTRRARQSGIISVHLKKLKRRTFFYFFSFKACRLTVLSAYNSLIRHTWKFENCERFGQDEGFVSSEIHEKRNAQVYLTAHPRSF